MLRATVKPIFKAKDLTFWVGATVLFGLAWYYVGSAARPFLIGLAFAYILNPIVRYLISHGFSRVIATSLVILVFFFGLGAVLLALTPFVARNVFDLLRALPSMVGSLQGHLETLRQWVEGRFGYKIDLAEAASNLSISQIASTAIDWFTSSLQSFGTAGKALMGSVEILLIVPFAIFYFLMDWERMTRGLRRMVPMSMRRSVYSLTGEIDAMIGGYFRGQIIVCVLLGSFYAIALWMVGLNYGVAVGIVSGLVAFIPYLGTLTCMVLSFGLGLAQFWPDWSMLLVIAAIIGVGQFFEGNFLTPYFVGRHVGLHPLTLMFGLLAMGNLYGFVGLLLAVPVTGAVAIILRRMAERYRASDFYKRNDSTLTAHDLTAATPLVSSPPAEVTIIKNKA